MNTVRGQVSLHSRLLEGGHLSFDGLSDRVRNGAVNRMYQLVYVPVSDRANRQIRDRVIEALASAQGAISPGKRNFKRSDMETLRESSVSYDKRSRGGIK